MRCFVTAGEHVNNIRAIARQPSMTTIQDLLQAMFPVGVVSGIYNEDPSSAQGRERPCVEAGSNTSTVILRVVGGDENMVTSPKGLGPKNDYAGECQQHIQKSDPFLSSEKTPTKTGP
jgi:hypothetical protein